MEDIYLYVGFYLVNAVIILFGLGLFSSSFIYFILKFRPLTIFSYRAAMYVVYRAWKKNKNSNYSRAFLRLWIGKKEAQGKKPKRWT